MLHASGFQEGSIPVSWLLFSEIHTDSTPSQTTPTHPQIRTQLGLLNGSAELLAAAVHIKDSRTTLGVDMGFYMGTILK